MAARNCRYVCGGSADLRRLRPNELLGCQLLRQRLSRPILLPGRLKLEPVFRIAGNGNRVVAEREDGRSRGRRVYITSLIRHASDLFR